MSATIITLPGVTPRVPATTRRRRIKPEKPTAQAYREKLLAEAKERAMTSTNDPVFYEIVCHLTAVIALRDHIDRTSGMTIEEEEKDEPHLRRLGYTCDIRLQRLLQTNPETLAGVVALLEHVGRNEFLRPEPREGDETFLTSFAHYTSDEQRDAQRFPSRLARTIECIMRHPVRPV